VKMTIDISKIGSLESKCNVYCTDLGPSETFTTSSFLLHDVKNDDVLRSAIY
jgi:hypothetical protein